MCSSSKVIEDLNMKVNAYMEDIQSYFLICDYLEQNLMFSVPMMQLLFLVNASTLARCNTLICIHWLLVLAPETVQIVNREIVHFVEKIVKHDSRDIPGCAYTGTIMKLLPEWKNTLNVEIFEELSNLVFEVVKSGLKITNKTFLLNILDQDRERFKKLKELEYFEHSRKEAEELKRYSRVEKDYYQLLEIERDLYFKSNPSV
eukprot:NODE_2_length_91304_cov_0.692462.p47 type:complete len:203 gc:universal NODE_2_length_91304_cov_0.692462:10985-11593(+)